jgi:hypothetical protein
LDGGHTVGTKEEHFGFSIKVNEAFLNSGALARDEEVQDSVNIFLEAESRVRSKTGQNCTLCAPFRNVLVLQILSGGETVVFIEPGIGRLACFN